MAGIPHNEFRAHEISGEPHPGVIGFLVKYGALCNNYSTLRKVCINVEMSSN